MKKITAIVLAAGKGKRMNDARPKVLKDICGQPLIYYVLKQLCRIRGISQVIIVTGYKQALVKKEIRGLCRSYFSGLGKKIQFVRQPKMLGTADALKAASGRIKCREVLVTCGDNPLIKSSTISSFLSSARKKNLSCSVLTSVVARSNQLGVVVYDKKGRIKAIRERISLGSSFAPAKAGGFEVNSGTYYFARNDLVKNLGKIKRNRRKKEYFLTDIVEILYYRGKKTGTYPVEDFSEVAGINDPFELQFAEEVVRKRIIAGLTKKGVKIINPGTTLIQEPAKIGRNTVIYPFTFIENDVIIGCNCRLGPFIHIRKGTRIRRNTQAGNFLEINRSRLGQGVKVKHFGYLGDTTVSGGANIGAGAVVANFDGKTKEKTYIDKGAFIGCDTVLVAPVRVGKGAVTGAGSVVKKNIGQNQVVIGVPARLLRKKE